MNIYKRLADYLRLLDQTKKQLKAMLYDPSFKLNVASSYSLLSTCLNNKAAFGRFMDLVEHHEKISIDNRYLFSVMLAEFINVGKIKGGGKFKRLITKYSGELQIDDLKNSKINKANVQIRLATNIKCPQLNNIQCHDQIPRLFDLTYDEYSKCITNNKECFNKKGLVIQSLSSCLPAFVLLQDILKQPQSFKPFDIIDCCAAPGNKTMQLADYIANGTIFAFQKDKQRAKLLQKRAAEFPNIIVANQNFLKVDPDNHLYQNVRMILADPSCSGSGMLTNFGRDDHPSYEDLPDKEKQRVNKLSEFQLNILRHCAKFKPLRIVYSTCSVYQQEDEDVVEAFVTCCPEYRVKSIKCLKDVTRGTGPIGQHCLRISPQDRKSDGFFVCLLKRVTS